MGLLIGIGESNNNFSWCLKFVMFVVELGQVGVNSTVFVNNVTLATAL